MSVLLLLGIPPKLFFFLEVEDLFLVVQPVLFNYMLFLDYMFFFPDDWSLKGELLPMRTFERHTIECLWNARIDFST